MNKKMLVALLFFAGCVADDAQYTCVGGLKVDDPNICVEGFDFPDKTEKCSENLLYDTAEIISDADTAYHVFSQLIRERDLKYSIIDYDYWGYYDRQEYYLFNIFVYSGDVVEPKQIWISEHGKMVELIDC